MPGREVLFLDRDGTLIEEPEDEQVDALEKLVLVPDVIPALIKLRDAGFTFVMITNQDGLGTADFPSEAFERPQRFLLELLGSQGIRFAEVLVCPHTAADSCACRKPAPGLVTRYLAQHAIDRERSFVIGDRITDMELARNVGIEGIRIGRDGVDWGAIAARLTSRRRHAVHRRTTRETDVFVELDLDEPDRIEIATGIGFFDHMLEQLAKHGGFSLALRCTGDLDIDEHHTVEDSALALGECLRDALGGKQGIARYGFALPMDEARAEVLLDLSGRPHLRFEGAFDRERVGQLPTELVSHFYRSLADSLRATLHVRVDGENAHHMIESTFKALGRALRQAVERRGTALPSTKGRL